MKVTMLRQSGGERDGQGGRRDKVKGRREGGRRQTASERDGGKKAGR